MDSMYYTADDTLDDMVIDQKFLAPLFLSFVQGCLIFDGHRPIAEASGVHGKTKLNRTS